MIYEIWFTKCEQNWYDGHDRMVSTLATIVGGERCILDSKTYRNHTTTIDTIRSLFHQSQVNPAYRALHEFDRTTRDLHTPGQIGEEAWPDLQPLPLVSR